MPRPWPPSGPVPGGTYSRSCVCPGPGSQSSPTPSALCYYVCNSDVVHPDYPRCSLVLRTRMYSPVTVAQAPARTVARAQVFFRLAGRCEHVASVLSEISLNIEIEPECRIVRQSFFYRHKPFYSV